jgi:hypothetical protein
LDQDRTRGVRVGVPFGTSLATGLPQNGVVATSSLTTVDVVAPHPFASRGEAARILGHTRPQSPAVRQWRQALDVVVDLCALVLMVLLIPFVILAIASPIVLILRAVLALIHRL